MTKRPTELTEREVAAGTWRARVPPCCPCVVGRVRMTTSSGQRPGAFRQVWRAAPTCEATHQRPTRASGAECPHGRIAPKGTKVPSGAPNRIARPDGSKRRIWPRFVNTPTGAPTQRRPALPGGGSPARNRRREIDDVPNVVEPVIAGFGYAFLAPSTVADARRPTLRRARLRSVVMRRFDRRKIEA